MAGVKISNLPAATTPLSGSETFPVVQDGTTKKATFSEIPFIASGAGAVASTVQTKLRENVSVFDFMTSEQIADVLNGTLIYDCLPAFQKAIESSLVSFGPWQKTGRKVYVPPGVYKMSDTLQIKKGAVHLCGEVGQGNTFQPMLVFPAGYTGIIIQALDTINAGTDAGLTGSANGSIVEGLFLKGAGTTAFNGNAATLIAPVRFGGHGIWMRGKSTVRNCRIENFSGNGFHTAANGGGTGNINNFRIDSTWGFYNKGHGFYIQGGDANVGLILNSQSEGNSGWALYDDSFLGLTVIGHQDNGNLTGSYYSSATNAPSVFIGCYTEGGTYDKYYAGPLALFIGGLLGTRDPASSGTWIGNGQISNYKSTATSNNGRVLFGPTPSDTSRMFGFEELSGRDHTFRDEPYFYALKHLNLGAASELLLYKSTFTKANNQARDYSAMLYGNQMAASLFNGFYIGNGHNYVGYGSVIPTIGTWIVGDRVLNISPTAGGYEGWICTGPGTSDTLSGVTATTTAGSPTFVVNSLGSPTLREGQYIKIAGVASFYQITTISGLNITCTVNIPTAVTSAAVSYQAPTFKTYGAISP